MASELTIQQALFGYESGHHLLQTSILLPTEVRHLLAVATDASGSSPKRGFDQSYTGLPLPGFSFYALFCTWPAPEMPRPGCVWSHVLFVELADIAELPDLGILRLCFHRPVVNDVGSFREPLRFHPTSTPSFTAVPKSYTATAQIVSALYGNPDQSIVLPGRNTDDYEDLLFAIWSQQWPRLRRNFRFSTGSFADRGRGGAAFDLQVTPEANRRGWQSDKHHRVIDTAEGVKAAVDQKTEPWVHSVVVDLKHPDGGGLRSYMRAFGADINNPRRSFKSLATIFFSSTSTPAEAWSSVLKTIAMSFGRPEEALLLKQASLFTSDEHSHNEVVDRAWSIVSFLCEEPANEAFGYVIYDFAVTAALLWTEKRANISALLARPPEAGVANRWSDLLRSIAAVARGEDIPWLWSQHPNLLSAFIRANPTLATAEAVWKMPERAQWQVAEALENKSLSEEHWTQIVHAMLTAGTSVAIRDIVQHAGQAALEGALTWTRTVDTKLPSPIWRDFLQPLAERRIHDDMLEPTSLAFCVFILSPRAAEKLAPDRKDVQELAQCPLEVLPESLRLRTAFFLLAIGLQTNDKSGFALVSRNVFAVHAALSEEKEPSDSWWLLRSHLPELYPWEDWDRCKRLRRAVRKWLKGKPEAFQMMLHEARSSRDWSLLNKFR